MARSFFPSKSVRYICLLRLNILCRQTDVCIEAEFPWKFIRSPQLLTKIVVEDLRNHTKTLSRPFGSKSILLAFTSQSVTARTSSIDKLRSLIPSTRCRTTDRYKSVLDTFRDHQIITWLLEQQNLSKHIQPCQPAATKMKPQFSFSMMSEFENY